MNVRDQPHLVEFVVFTAGQPGTVSSTCVDILKFENRVIANNILGALTATHELEDEFGGDSGAFDAGLAETDFGVDFYSLESHMVSIGERINALKETIVRRAPCYSLANGVWRLLRWSRSLTKLPPQELAVRQSAVSFETVGLSFEGVVAQPDATGGPWPGVVICHPHPQHGGSMDNNVVLALALGLAEEGFVTLRFNFRGVGGSQGEHAQGELEYQEALGALDLIKAWPDTRGKTGLIGYSFGSGVILRHEELQKEADALTLVSPALRYITDTPLKAGKKPALIVTGDRDRLVESEKLEEELASFSQVPECQVFDGVDHFWYGHEGRLVPEVARFFIEQLK